MIDHIILHSVIIKSSRNVFNYVLIVGNVLMRKIHRPIRPAIFNGKVIKRKLFNDILIDRKLLMRKRHRHFRPAFSMRKSLIGQFLMIFNRQKQINEKETPAFCHAF